MKTSLHCTWLFSSCIHYLLDKKTENDYEASIHLYIYTYIIDVRIHICNIPFKLYYIIMQVEKNLLQCAIVLICTYE